MQVIKTIRPGRDGSKQLVESYGDRLVCVRYRRDTEMRRNLVTVEIIVNQIPQAGVPDGAALGPAGALPWDDDHPVYLELDVAEHGLHELVRADGGYWDRHSKRWRTTYGVAVKRRLQERIDVVLSAGGEANVTR